MTLDIEIQLNVEKKSKSIEYPSQREVSFSIDPAGEKVLVEKITLNGIDTNIFYNTRFAIDGSSIVLNSVHEIDQKGIFTILLDDLYISSHRSNNWHSSKHKQDFMFQYQFTRNSFKDTYRDREHIGFDKPFIPCFGCSFTFGAHQPDDSTWPYLLRQTTGHNYINLGVGGSGIDGIYNNLNLLHKAHQFHKCVILFPGFNRRIVRCRIEDRYLRIPSSIDLGQVYSEFHFFKNRNLIEKATKIKNLIAKDEDERYSKIFLRKIIDYCKNNKIQLSVSSWDNDVYDYLQGFDNVNVLSKFPDMETFKDRADDGLHPHKTHYQSFVDAVKKNVIEHH